jgi:TPR repeat protein
MNKTLLAVAIGLLVAGTARAADESALEALRSAAAQGDVAAQYEMGVLYEFGFNMPDNLPSALAWYMAAADQGDGRAIKRRDLLQGQLSAAQVEDARRRRAEFATAAPVPRAAPPAAPAEPAAPPAAESTAVPVPEPKAEEPK